MTPTRHSRTHTALSAIRRIWHELDDGQRRLFELTPGPRPRRRPAGR